jgi:hypothetical protein
MGIGYLFLAVQLRIVSPVGHTLPNNNIPQYLARMWIDVPDCKVTPVDPFHEWYIYTPLTKEAEIVVALSLGAEATPI